MQTASLIPLCHPLPITKVALDLTLHPDRKTPCGCRPLSRRAVQTGVEMEALTAVSVACLTIYDMVKAVDRAMQIGGLRLLLKDGGKSGRYEAM